ncbi:hypothetical protein KT71_11650 [Congregibacter litoralis KT71]|uniref:Uncharacterized protein n=1 Tax=Congregibacter litoralis KT71 TaxID=314285 RepID=A4ADL3_9GAMM|nr:hypothetical protein KT71_11650 [Congregibacter litoralis KT71]
MLGHGTRRRQTKMVISGLGAALALLLILAYAVTAFGDATVSSRLHSKNASVRLLKQLADKPIKQRAQSLVSVRGGSEAPSGSSPSEASELLRSLDEKDLDSALPSDLPRLFNEPDSNMFGEDSAHARLGGLPGSRGFSQGGSSRAQGRRSRQGRATPGGFRAGGGVGGGPTNLSQGSPLEDASSIFDDLLPANFDSSLPLVDQPLDSGSQRKFRRGKPQPANFDPCVGGLMVSPCVLSATDLLEGLPDSPFEGQASPFRVLAFDEQIRGNGGGSFTRVNDGGNGDSNGGGSGSDGPGGTGGDGGINGGGNGGLPFEQVFDEPFNQATPVPAPAPIVLLAMGLLILLRRRVG